MIHKITCACNGYKLYNIVYLTLYSLYAFVAMQSEMTLMFSNIQRVV